MGEEVKGLLWPNRAKIYIISYILYIQRIQLQNTSMAKKKYICERGKHLLLTPNTFGNP